MAAEGETKASDIVRKFQHHSADTISVEIPPLELEHDILFSNVRNKPEPVMLTRLEVLLILNLTNL